MNQKNSKRSDWDVVSLHAPRFDPFPRLDEIVNPKTFELVQQELPPPSARLTGLFDALLAGHPEVLLQDVQEHPEKYDQRLLPLLEDLIRGSRKKNELTEDEYRLLNEGTVDFATYVPDKNEEKKKEASSTKPAPSSFDDDGFEEHAPDVDFPEDEPAPYWWTS